MQAGLVGHRAVAELAVGRDIVVVDEDGGDIGVAVGCGVAETPGAAVFAECLTVEVCCAQRVKVFVCAEERDSLAQRQLIGDEDDDFVGDLEEHWGFVVGGCDGGGGGSGVKASCGSHGATAGLVVTVVEIEGGSSFLVRLDT